MDDPERDVTGPRAPSRRPDPATLAHLVGSAVVPPRGAYRATARYVTVEGPPASELPRRFSSFRDDGPPRTGNAHDECVVVLEGRDRWRVTTAGGGEYRRAGDALTITYPGETALDVDVENVRAPNADWPYYAGHWAEELLLPHRLLGLLDDVVVIADGPSGQRLRGGVSLRQPEAYQGIAGEDVLEVEFVAEVEVGVIVEAFATTWDHRVSTYRLEVLG